MTLHPDLKRLALGGAITCGHAGIWRHRWRLWAPALVIVFLAGVYFGTLLAVLLR